MSTKTVNRKFHTDAGHGWLAVKVDELVSLNLVDRISQFSYIKGKTAYLEEDCDAPLYMEEMKKNGFAISIQYMKHQDRSPIRSYCRFSKNNII